MTEAELAILRRLDEIEKRLKSIERRLGGITMAEPVQYVFAVNGLESNPIGTCQACLDGTCTREESHT